MYPFHCADHCFLAMLQPSCIFPGKRQSRICFIFYNITVRMSRTATAWNLSISVEQCHITGILHFLRILILSRLSMPYIVIWTFLLTSASFNDRKSRPADNYRNTFAHFTLLCLRTCLHKKCMRIFEHNFVADKAKIRRRAAALSKVFVTAAVAEYLYQFTALHPSKASLASDERLCQVLFLKHWLMGLSYTLFSYFFLSLNTPC